MKDDFIFDGRYGSDFNLKICDITSNSSTDSSTISKTDFSTFQPSNAYKNYFTGSTSSEVLTTTFQVGHFENCQMQDFDDDLLEAVSRWFCREDGYHRFAFINSLDDTVEYNAKIDMNKIELGTRVIGLEFTVTTDSQIGYTKRKINKTLSADEAFIINDTSSKTGSSPIDVIIKCKQSGDLALAYSFNNKKHTTRIANCSEGEIISINNMQVVTSSLSSHDVMEDFNFSFPKIYTSVKSTVNTFRVNIPCEIEIKYELRRKVGI